MKATKSIVSAIGLAAALWWLSPSTAAPQGPGSTATQVCIIVTASEPEARKVLERLNHGEDFGTLAKSHSIDPSASDGGCIRSTLKPDDLRRELREALKTVAAGHVSGIVRIPSGYAILKLLPHSPDKDLPPPDKAPARPTKLQAIASAGTVRLTYDYGGFNSALQVVKKNDKPPGWDRDLSQACEVRVQTVAGVLEQLTALIARPGAQPAFLRDANALNAPPTPLRCVLGSVVSGGISFMISRIREALRN